jgi:hypothetical protein
MNGADVRPEGHGTAAITIAGVELLRRIHKGQFNVRGLRLKDKGTSALWMAVVSSVIK